MERDYFNETILNESVFKVKRNIFIIFSSFFANIIISILMLIFIYLIKIRKIRGENEIVKNDNKINNVNQCQKVNEFISI